MYSEVENKKLGEMVRESFRKTKEVENKKREIPKDDDILYSSDFIFEDYPHDGDSGSLFLATSKKNKTKKYIVKHEHYDCACNEYMYGKIANSMGVSVAPVKLFVLDEDKEKFKSDFVCGIEYLEEGERVGLKSILQNKDSIENWKDYFRFQGMESLFFEGDGIEVLLKNKKLYRIDTTDSFTLSEYSIYRLAYDFKMQEIDLRKNAIANIACLAVQNTKRSLSTWNLEMNNFIDYCGLEYLDLYLEPFYLFTEIKEEDIENWTYVLTYFYPNVIGKYYQEFLKNLKKDAEIFLSTIKERKEVSV